MPPSTRQIVYLKLLLGVVAQGAPGQEPNGSKLKCYNRADDGLRTRDLQLGKLALYQLSYVRVRYGF